MTELPEVLIVEDEVNIRELMQDLLQASATVRGVGSIGEARAILAQRAPDLLLLDVKLPDGDGLGFLEALRAEGVGVPAVVITAFGTVERAVAALQAGAADFLVKPFDEDRFRQAVSTALEAGRRLADLELEAGAIRASIEQSLVGDGLKDVVTVVRRVAAMDATVLIEGESGTGKQLVARALHEHSRRRDGAFVAIDCSAIAPTLLESELYGFERGAFTGAHAQKKGLVEAAEGGTLFLDEVGDMPMEAQSRLLRVLQEREVTRVGGRSPVKVDVRVIAATHRDLGARVKEGLFRHDLLYRLDVVPIRLPPLRERTGDLAGLLDHFLEAQGRRHGVPAPRPDRAVLAALAAHAWPGNVRELQNFAERAVVMGRFDLSALETAKPRGAPEPGPAPPLPAMPSKPIRTLRQAVADAEREAVVAALRHAEGNKAEAARLLGVSYKTLFNKIHEHGIQEDLHYG